MVPLAGAKQLIERSEALTKVLEKGEIVGKGLLADGKDLGRGLLEKVSEGEQDGSMNALGRLLWLDPWLLCMHGDANAMCCCICRERPACA